MSRITCNVKQRWRPFSIGCLTSKAYWVACVASVSVGVCFGRIAASVVNGGHLAASEASSGMGRAKIEGGGRGRGEKETLASKPHDFEEPVRQTTEPSDWCGMKEEA